MTASHGFTDESLLDETWQRFETDLALCLGTLENEEYLILGYEPANYYVQFAQQGGFGMRSEAAGNGYIEPFTALLTVDQYNHMRTLGWNGATETPEQEDSPERHIAGSPNFFVDTPVPVDYAALARLASATLREVYAIQHPALLRYTAFSDDGVQIRFPTLRISRRRAQMVEGE